MKGMYLTPLEIKIELLKAGTNQSRIAKGLGVSRQAVSLVVNQDTMYALHIRQAIADAIHKPLLEVFPDEQYRRPSGRIVKRSGFRA